MVVSSNWVCVSQRDITLLSYSARLYSLPVLALSLVHRMVLTSFTCILDEPRENGRPLRRNLAAKALWANVEVACSRGDRQCHDSAIIIHGPDSSVRVSNRAAKQTGPKQSLTHNRIGSHITLTNSQLDDENGQLQFWKQSQFTRSLWLSEGAPISNNHTKSRRPVGLGATKSGARLAFHHYYSHFKSLG